MRLAALIVLILAAILVPFVLWDQEYQHFGARLMTLPRSNASTGAFMAAILASDIVLPVPSSIAATVSGALLGFPAGVVANFLGYSAGCIGGYWLARLGAGRVLASAQRSKAEALWQRFGDGALAVSRAVPVLAEASVFFAGAIGVPFRRFLWITTLSNAGISILYAALGAYGMENDSLWAAVAGSVILPAAALGLMRTRRL